MAARKRTRTKRRNHEGYISTKPRKDGRYEASIVYPDGKSRSFYGRTYEEAEAKLIAVRAVLLEGREPEAPSRLTFAKLLDQWLTDSVRHRNAPDTFTSYGGYVRRHIAPSALGRMKVTEIRKAHISRFLHDKAASGLSPRTVQYLHAIIRRALGFAKDDLNLIANNPAKAVMDTEPVVPPEIKPMTPENARRLLEAVRGHRHELLIRTTLELGLRNGEALGLRWADLDLDRAVATFRGRFVGTNRDGWTHTSTRRARRLRTAGSVRTLALSPALVTMLREHRQAQLKERLKAGARWVDHDAVFCSRTGTPYHGGTFIHEFAKVLAKAGLAHMRPHDLRHGSATLMAASGADVPEIMDRLGHKSVTVTMRYIHATEEQRRRSADRMAELLSG